MDMTLDQYAYDFVGNVPEGYRYAEWKKSRISKQHKANTTVAFAVEREERRLREAEFDEDGMPVL